MHPDDLTLLYSTAWLLATSPSASLRNGGSRGTGRAGELTGGDNPEMLDALAAAYAEAGRFAEAVRTAQRALDPATSQNKAALAAALPGRIKLYLARQPYRELR